MKKDCSIFEGQLSSYIDRMLPEEESKEILKHLETCPQCRGEYEFLTAIKQTTEKLPTLTVDAGLHEKIMQEVAVTRQTKKKIAQNHPWRIASAFAAMAAVVAISVISFSSLPGHPDLTSEGQPEVIQSAQPELPEKETEAFNVETESSAKPSQLPKVQRTAPPEKTAAPAALTGDNVPLVDTEIPAGRGRNISGSEEQEQTLSFYFTEEGSEMAAKILSDFYTEDGECLVPSASLQVLCEKLESLSGYVSRTGEMDTSLDFVKVMLFVE